MSQDWEQIALSGKHLSPVEAEGLGARLSVDPSDIPSRLRLIGYLRGHSFKDEALRRKWEKHVLWFIEHHPDNKFVGSPFCSIGPGTPAYTRAVDLWKGVIDPKSASPEVLLNAARFFTLSDRERTRALLERGEYIDPSRPEWAKHLGQNLLRTVEVTLEVEERGKKTNVTPEARKELARQALRHLERALALASSVGRRFQILSECAKAALHAESREEAVRYANEILATAPECPEEPHRADYTHDAHVVLGTAALQSEDVKAACRELDLAGRLECPQAPVLRSFGPDFRLAGKLLERGERTAVLSYLDQCATFWKEKRVAKWKSEIERGGRPLMFTGYDPNDKS